MPETEVHILNQRGVQLAGTVSVPSSTPTAAVVLCQGLSGVRGLVLPQVAQTLAEVGIASVRFDYSGFGDSDGERGWVDPRARTDDALSVVAWLGAQSGLSPDRLGIYGHSYGGPVAIATATRDARVRAVVAVSGPGDGQAMLRAPRPAWDWVTFRERLDRERAVVAAGATPTAVPVSELFPFSPAFEREYAKLKQSQGGTSAQSSGSGLGIDRFYLATADAMLDFHPQEAAARLTRAALLLVNGERDDTAAIETVDAVFAAAPGPKRWVIVPGADHNTLDSDPGLRQALSHVVEWFRTHLGED